jgi:hypothetical protein
MVQLIFIHIIGWQEECSRKADSQTVEDLKLTHAHMGSALALEQNLRKDEKLMDERMDEVLF